MICGVDTVQLLPNRNWIPYLHTLLFWTITCIHLVAQTPQDAQNEAGSVPIISGGAGYIHNESGGASTLKPQVDPDAEETGRTIEIHARRYAFSPADITVKKGETVRLKLISDDVPHSLLIKDLGINQTITKGKPAEISLTPAKAGDFHGECGRFCGAGHGNMTIAVHVTGN